MARTPFKMAVVGDSVMWGTGLKTKDKIHTLVAKMIERDTQRIVEVQHLAQTGARITRRRNLRGTVTSKEGAQETPHNDPIIPKQVERIEAPNEVELVLVNGGINDVGVAKILDPQTTASNLTVATRRHCEHDMVAMLNKIRLTLPNAKAVVAGYFPIFSDESDPEIDVLSHTLTILSLLSPAPGAGLLISYIAKEYLLGELASLSRVWADRSRRSLTQAVARVNARRPRVFALAQPQFDPLECLYAPANRLFNLDENLDPVDPMKIERAALCVRDGFTGSGKRVCFRASVGHPNEFGARKYADSIIKQLRLLGVLPKFLANTSKSKREVHNLMNETARCGIWRIRSYHKLEFETLREAQRQGFDNCHWCLGGSGR